ncbi:SRPBCC domain-containing protein [Micromonospora sp. DT81.3]|uniref:SRPBCC domain-containing protein n=1 Tax=Actinomycetes TaxID=1760 RepID=UPI003CF0EAEB
MTAPAIHGAVRHIDDVPHLTITRRLAGSAQDAWRDLTASDRLEGWIGRWEGDPASGHVDFFMTAEGQDVEAERYTILECDPPRRFAGDTSSPAGAWHLWFELSEAGDETMLTFGQRLDPGVDLASVGPGWEYYLDRLVAMRSGRDVDAVEWDAYYPAMSEQYAALRG